MDNLKWVTEGDEDPLSLTATADSIRNVHSWLKSCGVSVVESADSFAGGLSLLRTFLSQQPEEHTHEVLSDRTSAFVARPRPYMPRESLYARPGEYQWAWIDPRLILLKNPGTKSLIHDNSNTPGRGVPPITGIAEFAGRIAAERGDIEGLRKLFGHLDQLRPEIMVQGWRTPAGGYFVIETNGNHRVAALAALGVPCVLAEVRWSAEEFDTKHAAHGSEEEYLYGSYRQLLHVFGVASFLEPLFGSSIVDPHQVRTQWPMLICDPESAVESLRAVEALTGSRYDGTVGRLPREWFDDPAQLQHHSDRLHTVIGEFTTADESSPTRRFWHRRER